MAPDLTKPRQQAWGMLLAVLCLGGIFLWFWSDDSQNELKLLAGRRSIPGQSGESISSRIESQRVANEVLSNDINTLIKVAGFTVSEDFKVISNSPEPRLSEPGFRWRTRFLEVRQRIKDQAGQRRIAFDEYMGFNKDAEVPEPSKVPGLLVMLQLAEKAALIVTSTDGDAIERFSLTPGVPIRSGPAGREPLVTEYPLTMELHGQLATIIEIIWRFSKVTSSMEHGIPDYPLIIRGLKINSRNTTSKDGIATLSVVLEFAGMQFHQRPFVGAQPGAGAGPGSAPNRSVTGGRP